jgi:nucleoside transporter
MVTTPGAVFIMLLLAMLCYMPTWGLTSAIAMTHSPSEKFPQIRVFGSIGWVAAGLFSIVAIKVFQVKLFDGTAIPLFCGAGVAVAGALHAMFLPHTPPPAKGQKASVADALGLRSLSLMKDFQFSLLIICTLIATIPFAAYWSYCSAFLKDQGFKYITVTMGWGQAVEMLFMLLVPVALGFLGLKRVMVIGLAAMLARYAAFMLGGTYGMDSLYFAAILVHGIIFGFFYVGGQIYIDRKAPKEMRAQAQGLIFLVSFGVGLLIGNFVNGALLEMGIAEGGPKNYHLMWTVSAAVTAVLLVLFVLLFRDPVAAKGAEKKTGEIGETEPPAEAATAVAPAKE